MESGTSVQSAAVRPEQLFDPFEPRAWHGSERRLMLAVLRDAIACYRANHDAPGNRAQAEFEEARCWIESTDSDWPFSFESICEVLGIDADALRDQLDTEAAR